MITKSRHYLTTLGFRWLARITSLLSVGTIALFFFAEPFQPARVRPREWVGLAFFPAGVVIGLIVAWWKEGLGASISLASLVAFYLIYGWLMGSNVNSLAFIFFTLPAFLFLITWLLSRSNFLEVPATNA